MTTLTQAPTMILAEQAQALIDARLDTIERMLLGQVSRADRLAIVREVEAQLHDLLTERNPDDTDRDAVIAALARLDPPEAYLPDEVGVIRRPAVGLRIGPTRTTPFPVASIRPGSVGSTAGKVSGILGILSILFIIPAAIVLFIATSSIGVANLNIFYVADLAAILLSTNGVALAAYSRLERAWSVVGLTTSIISLLTSLGMAIVVIL